MRKLFVSTGCTSSDILLAPVLAELRRRAQVDEVVGVGGGLLRESGVRLLAETTPLAAIGLAASFQALMGYGARALSMYQSVKRCFSQSRPDLAILVDNPGLNLWFLNLARRYDVPVLYYIPPEVWSVTRRRFRAVARQTAALACILPCEGNAYRAVGGNVWSVGHPAVDLLRAVPRPLPFNGDAPTVGLFPGSRSHEVQDLLPVLRGAAEIIRGQRPRTRFVMCSANEVAARLIRQHLSQWNLPVELVHRESHRVLSRCDLLLTCSGTATLEAAILGVPMVVMYRVHHWLDRVIRSCLLRFVDYPFFALPNYLLKRPLVPELRNAQATPERVAAEALVLLNDPARRQDIANGLAEMRQLLGPAGAVDRVADLVESLLDGPRLLQHGTNRERMAA